jgi:hypothetical protein
MQNLHTKLKLKLSPRVNAQKRGTIIPGNGA